MEELRFQITEETEDERIDKCMSLLVENLSRSFIQKLIKDGNVLVNGKPAKGSYRVKCEDEVVFSVPESVEPDIEPENIPLDILYEDADLIVVNKPKGMVVHPAAGHYTGTLVNALMYHCGKDLSGINGVLRPGIVHRIDRDTTGSVIACKNDKAHRCIAEQLKEHSINRRYRAICFGELEQEEGTIDQPIGRHPNDRKKMAVNPQNGKRAVTHYRVLQRFQGYTYIECVLRPVERIRSVCIWQVSDIRFWEMRCTPIGKVLLNCKGRHFTPRLCDLSILLPESIWKLTHHCRNILNTFWLC